MQSENTPLLGDAGLTAELVRLLGDELQRVRNEIEEVQRQRAAQREVIHNDIIWFKLLLNSLLNITRFTRHLQLPLMLTFEHFKMRTKFSKPKSTISGQNWITIPRD